MWRIDYKQEKWWQGGEVGWDSGMDSQEAIAVDQVLQGSGVQTRMLVVEMKDVDRFGTCFGQRYVKIWKLIEDRFGGKIRITDSRNQSKSLQELYLQNSLFIQHFQ